MDKQGADAGYQYHSVIFYHNKKQEKIADKAIKEVQKFFDKSVITDVKPLENFYAAEDYHQDYYKKNPNAPYCLLVIRPKLEKLKLK